MIWASRNQGFQQAAQSEHSGFIRLSSCARILQHKSSVNAYLLISGLLGFCIAFSCFLGVCRFLVVRSRCFLSHSCANHTSRAVTARGNVRSALTSVPATHAVVLDQASLVVYRAIVAFALPYHRGTLRAPMRRPAEF